MCSPNVIQGRVDRCLALNGEALEISVHKKKFVWDTTYRKVRTLYQGQLISLPCREIAHLGKVIRVLLDYHEGVRKIPKGTDCLEGEQA